MPTREEKRKEFTEWSFFFKTDASAAKINAVTKQLEEAGFQIEHTGRKVFGDLQQAIVV